MFSFSFPPFLFPCSLAPSLCPYLSLSLSPSPFVYTNTKGTKNRKKNFSIGLQHLLLFHGTSVADLKEIAWPVDRLELYFIVRQSDQVSNYVAFTLCFQYCFFDCSATVKSYAVRDVTRDLNEDFSEYYRACT